VCAPLKHCINHLHLHRWSVHLCIRDSGRQNARRAGHRYRFAEDKDSKEKIKKKTFVKTTVKPVEHILYQKYAAREVEGDDEELVLVREEDVLGYLV
jgi:hypothetical protein